MESNEPYNLEDIKDYWSSQVDKHKQSHAVSWSDGQAVELEIQHIVSLLEDGDTVLDVGCGNGYSAARIAMEKDVKVLGLDYISAMIEQARIRNSESQIKLKGTCDFEVGDIRKLTQESSSYDKVVVTRVIINLTEWTSQVAAIKECARVLKPGGLLLMSEAVLQGWNKMNAFRREWGLSDIPMPKFNKYLDEDKVVDAVAEELEFIELRNYSSTYFVGTRILKPLLAKLIGDDVNPANPEMEWNRWFAQAPAFGDYGTLKMFVFRKR